MLLLLATLALADIPPGPDYVETCTVANHARDGRECTSCEGWHGGREACEALEQQGYEKVCQTAGASVWDEVMCKAGSTPVAPADPKEPEPLPDGLTQTKRRSRCDVLGLGAGWWVIGLAGIVRRRR
ncbi:MAG: hypothetical protein EP330_00635 [Deltaproteobacteria bacterium]|nr:MAG: hypothetical protein EP330_00635 [Deltaproteobacteria bacterium]